jgi:hypothetical protein
MIRVSSEEASSGRDKGEVRFGDQSEDEMVQDSHVVCGGMFFEASLIFMQRDMARVMQAFFDVPV